jgi:hypothetical protein
MNILQIAESNPDNINKLNSILSDDDQAIDIPIIYEHLPHEATPNDKCENINDNQEDSNIQLPEEIVSDLVNNIIDDTIDKYTFFERYQPNQNDYMKRKIETLQNEVIKSFGVENFNYMDLKKGYSKVELSKKSTKTDIITKNKENKENTSSNFLSDAKVHKSRIELEKEIAKNKSTTDNLLKNKTERSEPSDGFMCNAIKKKSTIEIEKEKFIEQNKKFQEEQLKKKNSCIKSQVFKFDGMENERERQEKVESVNEATCEICSTTIGKTFAKVFPKCKHSYHNVYKILI